jgi:TonB family protein
MATLTHDLYRQPLFGFGDDPLFRRCLTGAGIAGALFLIAVLIAPMRQQTITHVEQLPERFARLIIEKPKAKPAPPAPEVRKATMEQVKAPEAAKPAEPPAPAPAEPPRARRIEAARERPVTTGVEGRKRAQEATASVQKATRSIDQSLAGLSSSLTSGAAEPARPGRRRARSVGSGRGGEQIGEVNATVQAGGADLGGSAVQGSLVAIGSLSAGGTGGGDGTGGTGTSADAAGGGSAPGVYRSTASLLAVVQKYAAGIQYCYGNELKHDPALAGKVVISLTVSASGRVTNASIVHDTVRSGGLNACALSQIREWRFPAIAEGVTTFQAPFVFTPPR